MNGYTGKNDEKNMFKKNEEVKEMGKNTSSQIKGDSMKDSSRKDSSRIDGDKQSKRNEEGKSMSKNTSPRSNEISERGNKETTYSKGENKNLNK